MRQVRKAGWTGDWRSEGRGGGVWERRGKADDGMVELEGNNGGCCLLRERAAGACRMKGAGSEAQGLVLLGALLVCHHGDQGLHGSAQIVRHVEQTADGGTFMGVPFSLLGFEGKSG